MRPDGAASIREDMHDTMHDPAMGEAYHKQLQMKQDETKALRYDEGKARIDLLPPIPLLDIGDVATMGAAKYEPRNIEKGIEWGRMYAPMMRHLLKWWAGQDKDPQSGKSHLAHAGFWMLQLAEQERTHPEFDDRPRKAIPLNPPTE